MKKFLTMALAGLFIAYPPHSVSAFSLDDALNIGGEIVKDVIEEDQKQKEQEAQALKDAKAYADDIITRYKQLLTNSEVSPTSQATDEYQQLQSIYPSEDTVNIQTFASKLENLILPTEQKVIAIQEEQQRILEEEKQKQLAAEKAKEAEQQAFSQNNQTSNNSNADQSAQEWKRQIEEDRANIKAEADRKDKARKSTEIYKFIEQQYPQHLEKPLLVRKGINDLGLPFGEYLGCVADTLENEEISFNGKSFSVNNAYFLPNQGRALELKFNLEMSENYVYIKSINSNGGKMKTFKDKWWTVLHLCS